MLSFKIPKDDNKYKWTNHVKDKMLYYGISEGLIKRIVRFPKRKEEGIAPRTLAVMQPTSNKKKPQEIWVMYQQINQKSNLKNQNSGLENYKPSPCVQELGKLPTINYKLKIISAWRYPGVSPIGKPIIIPDEILSAVAEICENDQED